MAKLFKVFNADSCVLTLEISDNYLKTQSNLSEKELEEQFNIFGRIMFDNILDKDRKNFVITQNEEGRYEYVFEC